MEAVQMIFSIIVFAGSFACGWAIGYACARMAEADNQPRMPVSLGRLRDKPSEEPQPVRRLLEIAASSRHHREHLEALAEECAEICGYSHEDRSNAADTARSIVEHGIPVREVLDKLFN